jgi:transketolase
MNETRDPIASFGEALVEVGEAHGSVIAVSADSSSGSGLSPFKKRFPQRHLEFGIMEQGVLGFASGLAATGKIPFVAAIAPFMTARPFEMFRNDLGYMRQNVKIVGRCAGLTYSDLGATHQSLDDIAIIRTIPGVTIVNPGDPVEIKKAVHAVCDHQGPVYLRIGKPPMPVLNAPDYDFQLGRGVLMRDGRDVSLIGTGNMLAKTVLACDILQTQGVSVRLINIHTLKPVDREIILAAAAETAGIVTVEEHYLAGGLGSIVAEILAEEHPAPLKRIGINDRYASSGPYEDLLGLYGLQPHQIAETAVKFLRRIKG